MYPGVSGSSRRLLALLPGFPGRNWSGLNVTGHHWMKLEVSGCPWVCLGGSRMFEHRLCVG